MNWKLAVFDLAGTTVEDNDAVAKCLDAALREGDYEVDFSEIVALMGIPKPMAIQKLAHGVSETHAAEIHQDFQERMIHYYRDMPEVNEVPGTSETFRWLKERNILVSLDTGFDRPTTNILLSRMPWEGLVDASITSDEVAQGRPQPDMIFALMSRFGVNDAKFVIKVGDTPSDLKQGRAACCGLVIGVCQGSHTREQLMPYPHDYLIESVRDLPELVNSIA